MSVKRLGPIIVAALVVIGGALVLDDCYDDRRAEWENRIDSVEARNDSLLALADSAFSVSESLKVRNDSLVEVAREDSVEIRERIVRVRAETPDSLIDHPSIVARDSIIDDLKVQVGRWRDAFYTERARAESLKKALTLTKEARDSLQAVLDDRPRDKPWWIPTIGLGPSAGLEIDGQTYVGAGINVTWEINL